MRHVLGGLLLIVLLGGCAVPRARWAPYRAGETVSVAQPVPVTPAPAGQLRATPPLITTPRKLGCVWRQRPARLVKSNAPKGGLWHDLAPKRWKATCTHRAPRAELKSGLLAGLGVAAVSAYGFGFWHYGSDEFHFIEEGWFSKDSYRGGADKTGHVTASHILTAVFSSANRYIGFDYKEAALRGAASAWTLMFAMELGDGTSDEHGFSYEDIICNTIGCTFGYFHETVPWFARAFDIRWEYFPDSFTTSSTTIEPTTAYGDTAYIFAINAGALYSTKPSVLDLLDFEIGYQVRDIGNEVLGVDRQLVYGVGLNLANLLRKVGWWRVAKIFDYYQAPFISLRGTYSFDR